MLSDYTGLLEKAEQARHYMNQCIDHSKQQKGHKVLGHHLPLTGPDYGHYGFDFAQQVSLLFILL